MVLMMARREAGPHERWARMLTRELENNTRKPKDLVKKWHIENLKRFN
jgi:hypothetical protein